MWTAFCTFSFLFSPRVLLFTFELTLIYEMAHERHISALSVCFFSWFLLLFLFIKYYNNLQLWMHGTCVYIICTISGCMDFISVKIFQCGNEGINECAGTRVGARIYITTNLNVAPILRCAVVRCIYIYMYVCVQFCVFFCYLTL